MALDALISTSKDALLVELGFVVYVMKPLYDNIKVFQKQSGGISDTMEVFDK